MEDGKDAGRGGPPKNIKVSQKVGKRTSYITINKLLENIKIHYLFWKRIIEPGGIVKILHFI